MAKMARALATSSRDTGLFLSSFLPIICLKAPSGGWPTRPCVSLESVAFSISWGVKPAMFLRTVSISARPCWCSRRSIYGIPTVSPLSLLKGIVSPLGGYYFPLPVCGFGHTVPVFFEHGDGNKVGDTLLIQQPCKSP